MGDCFLGLCEHRGPGLDATVFYSYDLGLSDKSGRKGLVLVKLAKKTKRRGRCRALTHLLKASPLLSPMKGIASE